jgi:hypothetical protein
MKKVMAATITFFCLLQSCAAAQPHEEGDGNCHHLFLPTTELRYSAEEEGNSVMELRCATTQRSEAKDGSNTAITFFSLF